MEIKYQLFENESLFVQKYTGTFSIEKYQSYTRYITEIIAAKPVKHVLIDFRDLIFNEIPEDFSQNMMRMIELRKRINENELKNKDVRVVFWVGKPIPTVIAQLFSANFSNCSYCSTEEFVLNTLTLPEHLNDPERIIASLENTF